MFGGCHYLDIVRPETGCHGCQLTTEAKTETGMQVSWGLFFYLSKELSKNVTQTISLLFLNFTTFEA